VKLAAGAAGVLAGVTGLALLVAPRRLLAPQAPLRRWLLETDMVQVLNERRSIERRVYRWHRLSGALVLGGAAAALALIVFLATDPRSIPVRAALGRLGFRVTLGVAATVVLALIVVGVCLLIRPSVLKRFEAMANRWIEPRASARHIAFSEAILRAPRLVGALLLAAAVVCVWPF
jgi:hypothetical protein